LLSRLLCMSGLCRLGPEMSSTQASIVQVPAEAKISGLLCSLGLIRLQRDVSTGVYQIDNNIHF